MSNYIVSEKLQDFFNNVLPNSLEIISIPKEIQDQFVSMGGDLQLLKDCLSYCTDDEVFIEFDEILRMYNESIFQEEMRKIDSATE